MKPDTIIEVDGLPLAIHFEGYGRPLSARLPEGRSITLQPWSCREHLLALERNLRVAGGEIRLDEKGYALEVLTANGIRQELHQLAAPLALWWAAGGEGAGAACEEETLAEGVDREAGRPEGAGWLTLGGSRFLLKPWTEGERMKALMERIDSSPEGELSIDIVGYLELMLDETVAAADPPERDYHDLDGSATRALISAVVELNVPRAGWAPELAERLGRAPVELAGNTLRICRLLGWTPSRVWETPAAEIGRLLDLLDIVEESGPAPTPPLTGLTAHPDTVIIKVEEEGS